MQQGTQPRSSRSEGHTIRQVRADQRSSPSHVLTISSTSGRQSRASLIIVCTMYVPCQSCAEHGGPNHPGQRGRKSRRDHNISRRQRQGREPLPHLLTQEYKAATHVSNISKMSRSQKRTTMTSISNMSGENIFKGWIKFLRECSP